MIKFISYNKNYRMINLFEPLKLLEDYSDIEKQNTSVNRSKKDKLIEE